ncbi:MAG: hypothetical protein HKP56_08060 [Anderseniella sp.]|nr:hypothetical protein [Anderseniella sp.]
MYSNLRRMWAGACAATALAMLSPALAADGYIVEQKGRNFSFNTATGLATHNGVSMQGLNSAARKGEFELRSFWEKGGFRATVKFGSTTVVDGTDLSDISRMGGFRFDRTGSYVYIRTVKGPKARVELVHDGQVALEWPRLAVVSVLAYRRDALVVSVFDKSVQRTRFYWFARADGTIVTDGRLLGSFEGCALLGAKAARREIVLENYCDPEKGSDLVSLDMKSGRVTLLLSSDADEIFVPQLDRRKGAISVLAVSGSSSAKTAFHAISGVLLRGLGEPVSRASDEAGKQSWAQSYRTLTLATLYRKSGHAVFADLATRAMRNTLSVRNADLGISGTFNPGSAWASRIYSTDRRSPVSFQINQAMISGSLLRSCEMLGTLCPKPLRRRIEASASNLVSSYEQQFETASGLYRIQYGAPFRFDGIWAPWNWQLTWAVLLDRVGSFENKPHLSARAEEIAGKFTKTWTQGSGGALWRYWAPSYYQGWRQDDRISQHRPARRAEPEPKRFEDVNHAGLSLMGLAAIGHRLKPDHELALRATLDRLLDNGTILPRDMDGNGPRTPRWLPGAGWDAFATAKLRTRYTKLVPGAASGHQLLAYADLFDPAQPFQLTLTHKRCSAGKCSTAETWSFDSLADFLADNPLFRISQTGTR